MFITSLFTVAKRQKQAKCPSIKELLEKLWYIYTMEYYSAVKNNEIMPFAAMWMDTETITLSKVSERKHHMISPICEIKKKRMQMNFFAEENQTHRF